MKLGLFTRDQSTSVSASYALIADRGLALDLDDESGRIEKASALKFQAQGTTRDWPSATLRAETSSPPLLLADDGNSQYLPIRITRRARSLSQDTAISAQVTRRWVELLQQTTFTVRFGALSSLEIRVPAAIADRWELLDKEIVDREELGKEADGATALPLDFQSTGPGQDDVAISISASPGSEPRCQDRTRSLDPMDLIFGRACRADDCGIVAGAGDRSRRDGFRLDSLLGRRSGGVDWRRPGHSIHGGRVGPARSSVHVQGDGLGAGPTSSDRGPAFVAEDGCAIWTTRSGPGRCIGSSPMGLIFRLPSLKVRVGSGPESMAGSPKRWTMIRHVPATGFGFPASLVSKPVLVELEFQASGQGVRSRWEAPRLLDGGVVLQVLWEARLPWNLELVGVPRGWSDENQWYWDGYVWKQRPWRKMSSLNEWILGTTSNRPRRSTNSTGRIPTTRIATCSVGPDSRSP